MAYRILVINPGSTTTKIAVYEDEKMLFMKTVKHDPQKLAEFEHIFEQTEYRAGYIDKAIEEENLDESTLDCVMCRGGLILHPPISSGGYVVDEDLCKALSSDELSSPHASNLGGLIGKAFSDKLGIPAYIYDAVTAGELPEVASITGFAEIKRRSFAHVLNGRAMGIKYAKSIGKSFEDLNIIVAHLGGGSSVAAYKKGLLVDSFGDDDFHMSAERSGSAPLLEFIKLCYSGKYSQQEMRKKVRGAGGLVAHFGTSEGREIQKMADEGSEKAKLMLDAVGYSTAKSIGALMTAFGEKTDVVILTGGLANSELITNRIKAQIESLAKVEIMAGENEMEALAQGGLRILKGLEKARKYNLPK